MSALLFLSSCSSSPMAPFRRHAFPKKGVYLKQPTQAYEKLGMVKTKINFPSLDLEREDRDLCRNYFNEAAQDLLDRAKEAGGDAVMEVRTVTLLENGKWEIHETPECSDDGQEGQVLAQGIVIKWKEEKK